MHRYSPSHPSILSTLLIASVITLLSACGGSSNNSNTEQGTGDSTGDGTEPSIVEGPGILTINGQPIIGINYSTATHSGVTSATGEFLFEAEEEVSFNLAGIEFGSLTALKTITLADFESQAIPTGYKDFERYRQQSVKLNSLTSIDGTIIAYANPQPLDRLSNRLFLLYSLDADNNADNGIDLSNLAENDLPKILAQVALPINLNTLEYTSRLHSRAKLIDYNTQYSGFNALAKFLADRKIVIQYPEVMCLGSTYNNAAPTQWSVNYKNTQQQTVLQDTFSTCAPMPTNNQATEYAKNYSADGTLRYWYQYDEKNRETHKYENTNGTTDIYSRFYHTQYTELEGVEDKTSAAKSYWYDSGDQKELHDITTLTYSANGQLESKLVDDEFNDLTEYKYTDSGLLEFEYYYSEYSGQCWAGDIKVRISTDTLTYDNNELLTQRSNVENCATNTYDYEYNDLGQTLFRKHNVDAKTDINPETISYEYEQQTGYSDSGDLVGYTRLSRQYNGELTNSQSDGIYDYDEDNRLTSITTTSTSHNSDPVTSRTSITSFSYNNAGFLQERCYGDACNSSSSNKTTYTYKDNGLIETITSSYNDAVIYKAYYFYNSDNLISSINFFDGTSLTEALEPKIPSTPDYETKLDYLSTGAISVVDEGQYKVYFRDPTSDENPEGYYQWFNLDLAEHLNRTLKDPRTFEYNGGGET